MSRGQKLLSMALEITNKVESFVVNTDGSLSQIEDSEIDSLLSVNEEEVLFTDGQVTETLDHNYFTTSDLSVTELNLTENPPQILDCDNRNLICQDQPNKVTLIDETGSNLGLIMPDPDRNSQDHTISCALEIDQEHISLCEQVEIEDVLVVNLPENPDVTCVNETDDLPTVVEMEPNVSISNETSDNIPRSCKRKKRHQVNPESWMVNKWKEARKHGQEYYGKKKNNEGLYLYNIKKNARKMKERCKCNRKNKSLLQCSALTENDRKKNFEEFWSLEWKAKKVFVQFLTKKLIQ